MRTLINPSAVTKQRPCMQTPHQCFRCAAGDQVIGACCYHCCDSTSDSCMCHAAIDWSCFLVHGPNCLHCVHVDMQNKWITGLQEGTAGMNENWSRVGSPLSTMPSCPGPTATDWFGNLDSPALSSRAGWTGEQDRQYDLPKVMCAAHGWTSKPSATLHSPCWHA